MRLIIFIFFFSILEFTHAQKIKIHENKNPNPLQKEGYNLIFSDDFDSTTLDKSVWNISDINNDGTVHCTDPNDDPFTMNPQNVWVGDGFCNIALTNDAYLGCNASAGEIKSYGVNSFDTVQSWTLDYGFYLEIRLKDLPISKGMGSAGWLFAAGQAEYNEIDIWETDGKHKFKYGSTYWWDESVNDCSNDKEERKQDHSNFRVKNLDNKISFLGIKLGNHKMDLSVSWLIYGVDWDENGIAYFLNGVKTKTIDLTTNFNENKPCNTDVYDKPLFSKNIRIGTGPNSLGDKESNEYYESDLPLSLKIDYVRIYVKSDHKAIKASHIPDQMCIGSAGNMVCTYFPNVKYVWESDAFSFLPNNSNIESSRWAIVNPDASLNTYYPVKITAIFPGGYTETLIKDILITDLPQSPTGNIVTIQKSNSCYYWAAIEKPFPGDKIFWSEDDGDAWIEGFDYYSNGHYFSIYGNYLAGNNYSVLVRTKNACDTSGYINLDFNISESTSACLQRLTGDLNLQITKSNKTNSPMKMLTPEQLALEFENYPASSSVTLYNLMGEIAMKFSVGSYSTEKTKTLESGIYLVVISEGTSVTKLFLFND